MGLVEVVNYFDSWSLFLTEEVVVEELFCLLPMEEMEQKVALYYGIV